MYVTGRKKKNDIFDKRSLLSEVNCCIDYSSRIWYFDIYNVQVLT